MYRFIISFLFLSISLSTAAQRISIEEYIEQYKDIAVSEMKRSGVPAAITLAQGILESENGNSELVKKSNNHFGIKCKSTWEGDSVNHDDDAEGECFRAYGNAADSYRDHSDFLRGNKRYASLFSLDASDYRGWAYGLKKAGYATNPRYPDLLIKYVEQYNLQQYSLAVINEFPKLNVSTFDDENGKKLPAEIKDDQVTNTNVNAVESAAEGKITVINTIKCAFYKKGTSLLAIAVKHSISLNKLMEFNDLTEDGLLGKDQYIFLHKKLKTGEKDFYIAQPGETLHDIAQKNGIQLQYLKEYNNLKDAESFGANTKLFLKPGFRPAENSKPVSKVKVHLVEAREGLYAIARKYNVTVQQLREWNRLDKDELKIGQEIIVSK